MLPRQLSTTGKDSFPDEYDGFPVKWFATTAEAADFMDFLRRTDISYKSKIVTAKRKPVRIAVMYLGEVQPNPHEHHVVPLDDLKPHERDAGNCWCRPEHDDDNGIWVHNSMDGREKYETGELELH